MGLRDRREARQKTVRKSGETFGRGGSATRFQMRQKMISIGDDYWIENEDGERVYRVDGKALRVRNTLDLEDTHGAKLCRIQTRMLNIRDTMEIEGPDGNRLALVKKALISPLRERWNVDREATGRWKVQGNIVDHEYEIEADGRRSPRSRRSGSGSGTPTASRSLPTWTRRWCSPSRSPSTRWRTRATDPPRRRASSPPGSSVTHGALDYSSDQSDSGMASFRCESRGRPHVPPHHRHRRRRSGRPDRAGAVRAARETTSPTRTALRRGGTARCGPPTRPGSRG